MKLKELLEIVSPQNELQIDDRTTRFKQLYRTYSNQAKYLTDYKQYANYKVDFIGTLPFNVIHIIIKKD